MAEKSLADKLRQWQELVDGMKPRLGDVPFLEGQHGELAALRERVLELLTEQGHFEARLREATQQRIEAETQAEVLAARMIGALKAHYGKYDAALHQFGIQPNNLPGPRRKKKEEPPPAEEEPATRRRRRSAPPAQSS